MIDQTRLAAASWFTIAGRTQLVVYAKLSSKERVYQCGPAVFSGRVMLGSVDGGMIIDASLEEWQAFLDSKAVPTIEGYIANGVP